MDQEQLLTTARLSLSDDIQKRETKERFLILKNLLNKTYLIVDRKQWRILLRFKDGISVSEMLPTLIRDHECPSLRTLYELLLKAIRAHILIPEGDESTRMKAVDWKMRISYEFAQMLGIGSILFGFFSKDPRGKPRGI